MNAISHGAIRRAMKFYREYKLYMLSDNSYMLAIVAICMILALMFLNTYNMNRKYARVNNVVETNSPTPSTPSVPEVQSDPVPLNLPDKDVTITLYYAPWCGISMRFMPEWKKLEKLVSDNYSNVKTNVVHCESGAENIKLCRTEGILGYPTVKIGDSNTNREYRGMRRAEDILKAALE